MDEFEGDLFCTPNSTKRKHNENSDEKKKNVEDDEEVTIDDIIKFVTNNLSTISNIGYYDLNEPEKKKEELKELQFQDIKKIDEFPEHIGKVFGSVNIKFIHTGVLKFLVAGNKANISFYSSIFTCLKPNFMVQMTAFQFDFLSKFLDIFLMESIKMYFNIFGFKKLGLMRDDLYNFIKNGIINQYVIRFVANYFHVNIFVLNLEDDRIEYFDEVFVPFKKNIFLLKYSDNNFEPMFTECTRFFNYSDTIIQFIIQNKNLIKQFDYGNDLKFAVHLIEPNIEDKKTDIVTDDVKEKFSRVDHSYKREELIHIACDLEIELNVGKKPKTKTILIKEINEKLFGKI